MFFLQITLVFFYGRNLFWIPVNAEFKYVQNDLLIGFRSKETIKTI